MKTLEVGGGDGCTAMGTCISKAKTTLKMAIFICILPVDNDDDGNHGRLCGGWGGRQEKECRTLWMGDQTALDRHPERLP